MSQDAEKLWYVVNTYAGQENRVKENLERRIQTMGLEDSLFDVVAAVVHDMKGIKSVS